MTMCLPGFGQKIRLLLLIFTLVGSALQSGRWCRGGEHPPEKVRSALRVGAAVVDVTPRKLPIAITGSIEAKMSGRVVDPLTARTIVAGDGHRSVAICIVDNCTLPQSLVEQVIDRVTRQTDLTSTGLLIAATHTHSAPAVMSLHGNDADEDYANQLTDGIERSIVSAVEAMRPAEFAVASVPLPRWSHVRRWLMRDGTAVNHPFTGRTDNRVQFNPGHKNPNKIRPVGTADPDVTVAMFRDAVDQTPLAALVNYNTHYAGSPDISADYFGVVCRRLGQRINAPQHFVALASNGNSGNVNCIDFSAAEPIEFDRFDVGEDVIDAVVEATNAMDRFTADVSVDAIDVSPTIELRRPTPEEVGRARGATADWIDQRGPTGWAESYARETIAMANAPESIDVPLRTLRIGDFAIVGIPCEVYGETGLGIKARSPFDRTIVIGWAGGYHGYLPTAEAFRLGGYTTWRCRSSKLEVAAEEKITAAIDQTLVDLKREQRKRLTKAKRQTNPKPQTKTSSQTKTKSQTKSKFQTQGQSKTGSAIGRMEVHPDIEIDLVAGEPQIVDPVAIRFDAEGRLWVVQMSGYPSGDGDDGSIRVLRDLDGDGYFETAKTFADGLSMPTGLQPWNDGVIVTVAGEILFLRDLDGDDRCDQRQRWFVGFAQDNEQLRANHPTLGVDGRIYVAGGLRGGSILPAVDAAATQNSPPDEPPKWLGPPVSIAGCDFAFDPRGGWFGAVAGNSQFGFHIDAFNHRIGVSNRNPAIGVTLPLTVVRRDPSLTSSNATADFAASGSSSVVQSMAGSSTTSHLHAGQYSAACGVHRADSIWLPDDWRGDLLVCEPTANAIQRLKLIDAADGDLPWFEPIRHQSTRDGAMAEAIASGDPRFRPVDVVDGPGGVYVVDMHRAIIEHPDWMPPQHRDRDDLRDGDDRGRIYRIRSSNMTSEAPSLPRTLPVDSSPTDLRRWLDSDDSWRRNEAVRRLWQVTGNHPNVESGIGNVTNLRSGEAVAAVALHSANQHGDRVFELAHDRGDPRLLAFAIEQFEPTDQGSLRRWLPHQHAAVRRAAFVRCMDLSESWTPSLADAVVVPLMNPPTSARSAQWYRIAATPRSLQNLRTLIEVCCDGGPSNDLTESIIQRSLHRLADASGRFEPPRSWLNADDRDRLDRFAAVLSALPATDTSLMQSFDLPPGDRRLLDQSARRLLVDAVMQSPPPESLADYFASRWGSDREALRRLRTELTGQDVGRRAMRLLAESDVEELVAFLKAKHQTFPPDVLEAAIDLSLAAVEGRRWFADGIIDGVLPIPLVTEVRAEKLRRAAADPDNPRAAVDQASSSRLDDWMRQREQRRKSLFVEYESALLGTADIDAGRDQFRRHCSACHVMEGFGHAIGPDISDARNQTPAALLMAILDPSSAIDAGYVQCVVVTDAGGVHSGLLIDDDPVALTLMTQRGRRVRVRKDELAERRRSDVSLMPAGFETLLSPVQMRDLIGYLKGWRGDPYATAAVD